MAESLDSSNESLGSKSGLSSYKQCECGKNIFKASAFMTMRQ